MSQRNNLGVNEKIITDEELAALDKQYNQELDSYKTIVNDKKTKLDSNVRTWFLAIINQLIDFDKKATNILDVAKRTVRASNNAGQDYVKFAGKLTECKEFYNANKLILMKGNIFEEYSKMILALESLANNLKSSINAYNETYSESLPFIDSENSLKEQFAEIMKLLSDPKYKGNKQVKALTVNKAGMDNLLWFILGANNNENKKYLGEPLFKEGKLTHDDPTRRMARLSTYDKALKSFENDFAIYKQLKAARDKHIADMRIKQQLGAFKPGSQSAQSQVIPLQQQAVLKA